MRKIIRNADEAAEILKELMDTPQLIELHFEFDISVNSGPIVTYKVERFAYGEEEIPDDT